MVKALCYRHLVKALCYRHFTKPRYSRHFGKSKCLWERGFRREIPTSCVCKRV